MFDEICGRAFQVDATNTPGHLNVEFPFNLSPGNYRVLGTDYDNYVVVWSCTSGGIFGGGELGWVMTRNPNPSQATVRSQACMNHTRDQFVLFCLLVESGTVCPDFERIVHFRIREGYPRRQLRIRHEQAVLQRRKVSR